VRFKLAEVDLNELVVLDTLVCLEVLGIVAGEVTDVGTFSGGEIPVHRIVVREEGRGGADLSTHVADGSHTSG